MGKKILYIKAQGLGDIISGMPFLATMKEQGYEVYQTFYDMRYVNKGVEKLPKTQKEKFRKWPMYGGWLSILQLFKNEGLIKDIIFIPYGYINILIFFIKNFKRFDEVVIPIKTKPAQIIAYILGKKCRVVFQHPNDTSTYHILADGEISDKAQPLFTYLPHINRPYKVRELPDLYITIFPSIFERSLDIHIRKKVIEYCQLKGFAVVIIGGEREKRFTEHLGVEFVSKHTIDMLGKNSTDELAYVLKNAKGTISGNGGPMRLANLLNKHCLNIHTVSAYLMQPPVDNISSFNIRPYHYNKCTPCEAANSTIGEPGIKPCVFYGTDDVGACRKAITFLEMKRYIDIIINK